MADSGVRGTRQQLTRGPGRLTAGQGRLLAGPGLVSSAVQPYFKIWSPVGDPCISGLAGWLHQPAKTTENDTFSPILRDFPCFWYI